MKKNLRNNLLIKSKKNLFLNTAGEHTSLFNGDGLDFKEIRPYCSGDDIRHINWKVTAKKRSTNVNIFNEDKQLNIVLVYLNSGGIYFGSKKSKQDTMVEILSSLGYSALKKNDLVSTIFFSNNKAIHYKPNKNNKLLETNIETAYNLNPLGNDIDFNKLSYYLMGNIKQKSLIFIIGDFLKIPNFKILGKKHEVYCAIVRDKLEEDLELMGEFNFIDSSTYLESEIIIDSSSVKRYTQAIRQHDKKLFLSLRKSNIKYQKIYTSIDTFKQLRVLVKN